MIKLNCKANSAYSVNNVLKKSVISDGFEKVYSVPVNHKSRRILRNERRVRYATVY